MHAAQQLSDEMRKKVDECTDIDRGGGSHSWWSNIKIETWWPLLSIGRCELGDIFLPLHLPDVLPTSSALVSYGQAQSR